MENFGSQTQEKEAADHYCFDMVLNRDVIFKAINEINSE